jgi:hypothetical protein
MPIFLATTSVSVTDSISPLIGLMADAYVSSPTTTPAGHGFLVSAARSREWTLSVNTPINPGGPEMGAAIRRGSGDLPPALTLVTSTSPQGALYIALGYTLGRTANATHDVTFPAAGTSNPLTADGAGVHFAVSSIAYPLTARAAISYTLDPSYQSALVGGGRVGFMVSKAASAGVYAVPGTPMAMPIAQATEALAQVPWPTRGTFTGITVVAYSSTVVSGGASPQFPTQFTLRVAGGDTTLTATASGTASLYAGTSSVGVAFGDLVSLKVQALSSAVGSYFHGWCELMWLPSLADPPTPPAPPPAAQPPWVMGGAQFSSINGPSGEWLSLDGVRNATDARGEVEAPMPSSVSFVSLAMQIISLSAPSIQLRLVVDGVVQTAITAFGTAPGTIVATGTVAANPNALVCLQSALGGEGDAEIAYSLGYMT